MDVAVLSRRCLGRGSWVHVNARAGARRGECGLGRIERGRAGRSLQSETLSIAAPVATDKKRR